MCNIDSTNMTPSHWLAIAQAVETHYETYDGFVICHGTDTLAYTAAALSYLIQDSPKPIVLTGSQKPIHMDITDSKTNLLDSFTVACDRAATRGDSGVRRGGDPGNPGPEDLFQELWRLLQHQLPCPGGGAGGASGAVHPAPGRPGPPVFPRLEPAGFPGEADPRPVAGAYLAFALAESDGVLVESFGVGGVPAGDQGQFYDLIPPGRWTRERSWW